MIFIDNSNNMDFNKILEMLEKMDKTELEKKLKQAQDVLNKQKEN